MIVEKACWERGCACYDYRLDEGVEVALVREWQGLTHKELTEIIGISSADSDWNVLKVINWAKAIEAKLKEKNNAI